MWLLLLLCSSLLGCSRAQTQCSCVPGDMIINQGTLSTNFSFASVTLSSSPDGCDLTVRCEAILGSNYPDDSELGSLDFQYMRCVNGNWIPYLADIDYLAVNDRSDPDSWITYNNIFCIQPQFPTSVTTNGVESTTTLPVTSTTQPTTKYASTPTTTTRAESPLCSCFPSALIINQGTPSANTTFASVTLSSSEDGCDLTVHCEGRSPLTIGGYYSSTAQGDSPILDMDNLAILGSNYPDDSDLYSLDFQYMRCVNGNWIPYLADIDYLAVNDRSDPDSWITYNNIFCIS